MLRKKIHQLNNFLDFVTISKVLKALEKWRFGNITAYPVILPIIPFNSVYLWIVSLWNGVRHGIEDFKLDARMVKMQVCLLVLCIAVLLSSSLAAPVGLEEDEAVRKREIVATVAERDVEDTIREGFYTLARAVKVFG
ncbi:hypothetical protein PoB_002647000 [Plakobranchus ocellatus]|uniref:Uncharacterized protein n=1 Tax=Plakobranchus ocellatus TaxID=259542 RepID=A0AAV3ZVT3_9GAST|nr:hypothetical protein PoB_002647000 [Plakobranchus ocellatus]